MKIEGFICTKPTIRTNAIGTKVSRFIIAVERSEGLYFYFPCIAYGIDAECASQLDLGHSVALEGMVRKEDYSTGKTASEFVIHGIKKDALDGHLLFNAM